MKEEVSRIAADLLDEVAGTPEALIAAREDCMAAIRELRIAADELEERALARWPSEGFAWEVRVDGLGVYHRGTRGDVVTWDHRSAGLAVARAAQAREEIHHPNDVVDVLLTAGSVDYWRLRQLRSMGIDPDVHRTVVKGRPCIHLA